MSARPAGLITDVDGTISPIVANPADAVVLPGCRRALAALATKIECVAILSGRHPDVARDMLGLDGIECFGLHGMARWSAWGTTVHPEAAPFEPVVRSIILDLDSLRACPGVVVEEKGPMFAVHYRQAPDPSLARDFLLGQLAPLAMAAGMVLVEGRLVIEVRPPLALGKGWAITELARERALASVVYLGDDATDIDAFEGVRTWRAEQAVRKGVAIAVASSEMPTALAPCADYVLASAQEVEAFLLRLAA